MREKEELVKASTSDENLKINVEDISEVKELKGKEVEDLRVIMRKAEVEKINEEIDLEDKNEIKYRNDSCEKEPSVPKSGLFEINIETEKEAKDHNKPEVIKAKEK